MSRVCAALREHRYFLLVVTVLTLVMTFPTIVYVFRTDVFWHPGGDSLDIFVMYWDIWYGKLILTGQADRFYTDLIYYPDGVSLAYQPLFSLHTFVVNLLQVLVPLSNAFSLAHLLIILSSASAAYVYLLWLFRQEWLAIFGAVIYGLGPQVIGHPNWPAIAWIAPMPLVIYFVHRGLRERRALLIILAGLVAGLTFDITPYFFVCVLITLGLFLIAMATSRWRDSSFWLQIILLMATLALACSWRLIPMVRDSEALDSAVTYYSSDESRRDLLSFVVNPRHPVLGPLADAIVETPDDVPIRKNNKISQISYLGFLPLTLIGIALFNQQTRQKMLPWLVLLLVFIILHLGSTLHVNGTNYENFRLPKYYLNILLPAIIGPFGRANHFMAGVCLPLAILSCYGLLALQKRIPVFTKNWLILVLIAVVAFEYYIPVWPEPVVPLGGDSITQERLAFLDWLEQEEEVDIRLINLPFGRSNAKLYLFYQSLSGYPQTEGAISRVPDSAYNYIRSNDLLNAWYNHRPVRCEEETRDTYLEALQDLADEGFSHIVFHYDFRNWENIVDSFQSVTPSYSDDFVSIYRLADLRASCPN